MLPKEMLKLLNEFPLLLFQIISGQFLPKPNRAEDGEVIDPYVSIKVWGHPLDAQKQKTNWINNNGNSDINFFFLLLLPNYY